MTPPTHPIARPYRLAALAVLAALLGGCEHFKSGDATATAPSANRTDVPTAPRAASPTGTRLKAGIAPIHYLVGPGGTLQFFDATDDKSLATAAAAPQALVTIEDDKGIAVAGTIVKPGPLPKGHRYEIWLQK